MIISTDFVNVPTRTIDSSWTLDVNDPIMQGNGLFASLVTKMVKEINKDMKKCASGTKARKRVKRHGRRL